MDTPLDTSTVMTVGLKMPLEMPLLCQVLKEELRQLAGVPGSDQSSPGLSLYLSLSKYTLPAASFRLQVGIKKHLVSTSLSSPLSPFCASWAAVAPEWLQIE